MSEYERIKEYICNEPRMKPFLDKAMEECYKDNCQSWVAILELSIDNLLDAYEDVCNNLDDLEKQKENKMEFRDLVANYCDDSKDKIKVEFEVKENNKWNKRELVVDSDELEKIGTNSMDVAKYIYNILNKDN